METPDPGFTGGVSEVSTDATQILDKLGDQDYTPVLDVDYAPTYRQVITTLGDLDNFAANGCRLPNGTRGGVLVNLDPQARLAASRRASNAIAQEAVRRGLPPTTTAEDLGKVIQAEQAVVTKAEGLELRQLIDHLMSQGGHQSGHDPEGTGSED